MIGQNDQRAFYRMMVNAECTVIVLDNEAPQTYNAICRDLSATGMAVELDSNVEKGAVVQVKIASTNAQIPSLSAKGKVLRSAQEGETWSIGIEILEMS
ncbi:PilZ domain-containing protein [Saccharobesus litoralis]|uniref:PilZ domain-containing protein n=1 Tax=Saccharobesus litoralis TaxID=2172099 RepID=A0A2S0VU29_9ALTE|nr:PilZ domain-containing protein [Saccharobesus litoralis]AWB67726.1 PilZ domain-containing protein [Saccharobesus litoralis]